MKDKEVVFGPPEVGGVSRSRRVVAEQYVERALAATGPLAVRLQRMLIQRAMEPEAGAMDLALGYKASETVLDRFMGKAAQSVNVTHDERPAIVFDSKLANLNAALAEAVDVRRRREGEGPMDTFARVLTAPMVDGDGVVI